MNSFGRNFRVSIFGESHGKCVGVTLDGVRPGMKLTREDFEPDLSRRRGGHRGSTTRVEADIPEFYSGIVDDVTTGAPLTIVFINGDKRSQDYALFRAMPRPGHADYAAGRKFNGFNDIRGGGHTSARLTAGLVAAGVVAKRMLEGITISARLISVGGRTDVDAAVEEAMAANDSIGGLIECRVTGLPAGLGEPFFDSAESLIAHLLFSIPAVKGVEFGTGFAAAAMRGTEFNDCFDDAAGHTRTNNSGGINGGITNGNELVFRAAFRPTPSIYAPQQTFNFDKKEMDELVIKGRHDSCVALRAPVVVEAACAIALADMKLTARQVEE